MQKTEHHNLHPYYATSGKMVLEANTVITHEEIGRISRDITMRKLKTIHEAEYMELYMKVYTELESTSKKLRKIIGVVK